MGWTSRSWITGFFGQGQLGAVFPVIHLQGPSLAVSEADGSDAGLWQCRSGRPAAQSSCCLVTGLSCRCSSHLLAKAFHKVGMYIKVSGVLFQQIKTKLQCKTAKI